MIKLNNVEVIITRFPDNTIKFDIKSTIKDENEIMWKFESMEELFTLIGIMSELKSKKVNLYLPYLPNARMDKVQNKDEGFMLKYFIETIDSLGFDKVTILDPHSEIYKKLHEESNSTGTWFQDDKKVKELILTSIKLIKCKENSDELTLVYPDKGARNRYSSLIGVNDNLYGVKERNQSTGEIINFDIIGDIPNNPILIVDDISSRGRTFHLTAKKLREKGFKGNIYLYITHAENAIHDGKLLKHNSEIEHIFTTNSLLTKKSNKMTIFNIEGDN